MLRLELSPALFLECLLHLWVSKYGMGFEMAEILRFPQQLLAEVSMKTQNQANQYHPVRAALIIALLIVCAVPSAFGMGMDFGGGGTSVAEEATCAPEQAPVIVPGPLGSPLRIEAAGDNRFLVTDYRKQVVFQISSDSPGQPEALFAVAGKPLSTVKIPGRRGAIYLVGNDDTKTVDEYVERKGQVRQGKTFFRKTPVQALDMAVDMNTGLVYLVDGLAGEVKVINEKGRLVNTFGGFGQLKAPKGIALDLANNEVMVSDYGDSSLGISSSIEVFNLGGDHLSTITGSFSRPQGLAAANGKIYVADAVLGQILEFDRASGSRTFSYGCFGTTEGHLLMPMDVALGANLQDLFVADNRNGRISVLPFNP